ncbi:MAG: ABC transporter permease [Patescibacteria group bacterium]
MTTYMWALFAREVKRFQKIWFDTVAAPIVSTVLYLAIFSVVAAGRIVAGADYTAFVYTGLLGMMMVNSSFSNPAFALILSKNVGTIVDIQLAPIAPWKVGIAYAMAAFTRGLFTVVIAALITIWFIPGIALMHVLVFVAAMFITGLEFGMLGVIIGLLIKNFESFTLVMTFIMQPMIFLAGIFYPLSSLPAPWDYLSLFNPLHHNINLIRYGMIGYADASALLSFAVMLSISAILFIVMNRIAVRSLKQ